MPERFLNIARANWKHHLFPYTAVSFVFCLAAPLFLGTKNLEPYQVAKVIEMYLSFLGVLLLIPVFLPDVDRSATELIRTKKEPMLTMYHIRLLQSLVCLLLFGCVFLLYLKQGGCTFSIWTGLFGFLANTCFLGGMGMLVFSVTDHMVFAYMLPLFYYVLNIGAGARYLGKFYLFSMQGGNVRDKIFLLVTGILCIELGIFHRRNGWKENLF